MKEINSDYFRPRFGSVFVFVEIFHNFCPPPPSPPFNLVILWSSCYSVQCITAYRHHQQQQNTLIVGKRSREFVIFLQNQDLTL